MRRSFHSVLRHYLIDKSALVDFLEDSVVDQSLGLDVLDLRIAALHKPDNVSHSGRIRVWFAVEPGDHIFITLFRVFL